MESFHVSFANGLCFKDELKTDPDDQKLDSPISQSTNHKHSSSLGPFTNIPEDVLLYILQFIPLLEILQQKQTSCQWRILAHKASTLVNAFHFHLLMSIKKTKRILEFLGRECRKLKAVQLNSKHGNTVVEFLKRVTCLEELQVNAEFETADDGRILTAITESIPNLKVLRLECLSGFGWSAYQRELAELFHECKHLEHVKVAFQVEPQVGIPQALQPLLKNNKIKILEMYFAQASYLFLRDYKTEEFPVCTSVKILSIQLSEIQVTTDGTLTLNHVLEEFSRIFPELKHLYIMVVCWNKDQELVLAPGFDLNRWKFDVTVKKVNKLQRCHIEIHENFE